MTQQSVPLKVGTLDLTRFSQLPSAAVSYFLESYWRSEITCLLKSILVLGKARSLRAPNLGCGGAESPGWFDVSPKTVQTWRISGHIVCDEDAHYQLPIAMAFWIIWILSAEECSSLMQNMMWIHCSTHSFILNVRATQYTCSLKGILSPPLYSEVIVVHTCTFQSTLLGCQVALMSHNLFSLY